MSEKKTNTYPLGEIKLPYNKAFTGAITSYTRELCQLLKLESKVTTQLQIAVEETFINAIEHSHLSPSNEDLIHITYNLNENDLTISFREKGIPFDIELTNKKGIQSLEDIDAPGLGMTLIKSFVDSVELFIHGRSGKEIRLTKKLEIGTLAKDFEDTKKQKKTIRPTAKDPVIRQPTYEELSQVSALAWKCYGYTQEAFLYDLPKMQESYRNGTYIPMVAFHRDTGNMLGHICFKIHDISVKVGEMGLAFMDPGYRTPGIMHAISHALKDKGREINLLGFFDCSVTTHIYSQKPIQEQMKSTPCGVFFAIAAEGMSAKELGTTVQKKGTVVNHYFPYDKTPMTIYPPENHQDIIGEIYHGLELKRIFSKSPTSEPPSESVIHIFEAPEELNVCFITVQSYGKDYSKRLRKIMDAAKAKKKDALFLFAPLADIHCPNIYSESNRLEFSFAGIMPHIHNGKDRLLMQWVNTQVDVNAIRIYGDFNRKLFSYILDELKQKNQFMIKELN